jgi:hypothetical protein
MKVYEFNCFLRVPASGESEARERAGALADAVCHGEATLSLDDSEPFVEDEDEEEPGPPQADVRAGPIASDPGTASPCARSAIRPAPGRACNGGFAMSTLSLVSSACPGRFKLDRDRLANHLIAGGGERFGFDGSNELGFAAAIAERFEDAVDSDAILGPPGVEAALYPVGRDLLIAAVREREPVDSEVPLRQLASFCFEAREVARYGDERFEECCAGIEAVLARAGALLPSLAALHAGERGRAA